MSGLPIAWELVQSVLLVGSALLLAGLTYNLASILRRIGPESPPDSLLRLGAAAPELRSRDVRTGQPIVLAELSRAGCPALVAFLSPGCKTCVQEVSELNKLAAKDTDLGIIAVIADGTGFDFEAELSREVGVVTDPDNLLHAAFDVRMRPHLTVIDREGRLIGQGARELQELEPVLALLGRFPHPAKDGEVLKVSA